MTARGLAQGLRRADPVMLWGFGAVGIIFVFTMLNLTTRSMWWDELFSMALADPATPAADGIQQIREDVHPPLYFFGLRLWLGLWNTSSEYVARAFNLIPFAFAAWMAARALGQKSEQPRALWLVLFFAAFGVYWYLQEARMYAMMIMQSLCGCLVVLDYEQRRTAPVTPAYVAILAVVFVVLPLGHWFSLGFAGCLLIGLLAWSLVEKRYGHAALFFTLGAALGGIGLAWILANAKATVGAMDGYGAWVYGGRLTFNGLRIAAVGTLLHTLTLNPFLIAAALLGMWQVATSWKRHPGAAVILAVSVLMVLAILGVSLVAAMYQIRNFVWLVAPLTLFAAIGLQAVFARTNLSRVRQAAVIVGLIAVSAAIAPFASKLSELETYDWRGPARLVTSTPGCEGLPVKATAYWLGEKPSELEYRYSKRIAGYYVGGPDRVELVLRHEKVPVDRSSPCPVVLWALEYESEALAAAREVFGPEADRLETRAFDGHTVFLRPATESAARP